MTRGAGICARRIRRISTFGLTSRPSPPFPGPDLAVFVALEHADTRQYLTSEGEWSTDLRVAHRFPDHEEVRRFIQRHACESQAWRLVRAAQVSEQ